MRKRLSEEVIKAIPLAGMALGALVLPLLVCIAVLVFTPPAEAQASSGYVTRHNTIRQHHGLHSLRRDPVLMRLARQRALHIQRTGVFAHASLKPVLRAGNYRLVGENLAMGYSSKAAVMRAWMHSPGHRHNILEARYRRIGFATAGKYIAVLFAR